MVVNHDNLPFSIAHAFVRRSRFVVFIHRIDPRVFIHRIDTVVLINAWCIGCVLNRVVRLAVWVAGADDLIFFCGSLVQDEVPAFEVRFVDGVRCTGRGDGDRVPTARLAPLLAAGCGWMSDELCGGTRRI